jgi:hypothetical protein
MPAPWEGQGKLFTRDLETLALTMKREKPVAKAGDILVESNTRLWWMLLKHEALAYYQLDFAELTQAG